MLRVQKLEIEKDAAENKIVVVDASWANEAELWLQGEMRSGRITIGRVSTENNIADLFTKHLPRRRLEQLIVMMKLSDEGANVAC